MSQMISNVPAMLPMTIPAIAPPESVLGHVSEVEEVVDCRDTKVLVSMGAWTCRCQCRVRVVWFWFGCYRIDGLGLWAKGDGRTMVMDDY